MGRGLSACSKPIIASPESKCFRPSLINKIGILDATRSARWYGRQFDRHHTPATPWFVRRLQPGNWQEDYGMRHDRNVVSAVIGSVLMVAVQAADDPMERFLATALVRYSQH